MSTVALPIIDLARLPTEPTAADTPASIVEAVADAAARFGFFQVVNHGVDESLVADLWTQAHAFFAQPVETKRSILRTLENSRGYYDRELTKQKRDLKEVFDWHHPPRPDLASDDPANHLAVDGVNQWPDLDGYRETLLAWLDACEQLSLRLLAVFAIALDESPAALQRHFAGGHTSAARLNHYPLGDLLSEDEAGDVTPLGDMALHHHSDAGALTVLLQDDIGGLQVEHDGEWIDVAPLEGAFVINTGDMMQVWSNDRFRAALHRVSPRSTAARYSVPYFFTPSYATDYAPLPGSIADGDVAHYRTLNWGDFRQGRSEGDFGDYGTEIQISQFRIVDS